MPGFLNIAAPPLSNLNLAAQLLMGGALLVGMMLARRRRYRAHAVCQSTVVLLNLIPIISYMVPAFRRVVLPKLPAALNDRFYALPTTHAALGSLTELLGLFIILRAGTKLLPSALRFENYKLWMRSTLLLWWVVIALGLATYLVWHNAEAAGPEVLARKPQVAVNDGAQGQRPNPPAVTITMRNFSFEPQTLTVDIGTVVIWQDTVGRHSVKADDGSFESDVLAAGGEFRHRFERAGRYPYYCTLHGSSGGHDMAGAVIVQPRSQP
ncbi:MAG: DUF420 domain-containing protein [Acidobacteriota bacterium]|nr:DUF420 domain-containing protein [Acidobacteriota bacterium]